MLSQGAAGVLCLCGVNVFQRRGQSDPQGALMSNRVVGVIAPLRSAPLFTTARLSGRLGSRILKSALLCSVCVVLSLTVGWHRHTRNGLASVDFSDVIKSIRS